MEIKPTDEIKILEDKAKEEHRLVFSSVKMDDFGTYTLMAKNTEGTTTEQANLNMMCKKIICNNSFLSIFLQKKIRTNFVSR